jgi:uncharacterized protein YbjT (DUF2867 family)
MNPPYKTAVVAGASGLVGSHVLQMLLDSNAYTEVISIGRRQLPLQHPKLKQSEADFMDLPNGLIPPFSDVFCALGTTIRNAGSQEQFVRVDYDFIVHLAKAAANARASKFLLVSALGADAQSSIFYNKIKGQTEEAIQLLPISQIHIFRPSLLLGDRTESRIGETLGKVFAFALSPFLVGSWKKYKAIKAFDVAKAMYKCAQISHEGVHIYESDRIAHIAENESKNTIA